MMRARILSAPYRRSLSVALALSALVPTVAEAQTRRSAPPAVLGEAYHVEVGGAIWTPSPFGIISTEKFGILGTDINFVNDLAFRKTRFKELRLVLRPGVKHRFRVEYTPIRYAADATLQRTLVFNGRTYPVSIPIQSGFDWTVWRVGYEYDAFYRPRGFVGILFEVRTTQLMANLTSTVATESTTRRAPLPAIGLVARGYVLPELAVDFEVSGFKIPHALKAMQGSYYDWDVHGTLNLTNNVGVQVGWRRMTTNLTLDNYTGDLKFQGLWFGGVLRY
jgi:hypothetical protein